MKFDNFCSPFAETGFFIDLVSFTHHLYISEIIWVKKVRAIVVCGFLMKWLKNTSWKFEKNCRSYLLNTSQSSPIWLEMGWIGCTTYLAGNPQTAPTIFFKFSNYPTTHVCAHILATYHFWVRWCVNGPLFLCWFFGSCLI